MVSELQGMTPAPPPPPPRWALSLCGPCVLIEEMELF